MKPNPPRPMRKLAAMMTPLLEDTTSSDISFLPSGFVSARKELRKIGKYKSQWHVELLESADGVSFNFENHLKLRTPKEHCESFCGEVLRTSGSGFPKLVSIRHVIEEAKAEVMDERRKELDHLVRESLSLKQLSERVGWFQRVFGGRLVECRGVAVDLLRGESQVESLLESVHGTLLTRGKVEMLWSAIHAGDRSGISPRTESLSGASAAATCYGHRLLYTVVCGREGGLRESIRVSDGSTALRESSFQFARRSADVISPGGRGFTPSSLLKLKKELKESDEHTDENPPSDEKPSQDGT